MPRSLKTEGIRPLGRLAFVDNFEAIYSALKATVEELVKPDLLAKTAETIGLSAGQTQPKVYVVSSISGGSGSGMMNDMAYAIKVVLAEQGLPMGCLQGVMLHSTSVSAGDPGLAATNSFAFLTELRHFTENGFPGDSSIGLPELPNEPPFEHCYYLDLGTDLEEIQLESKFSHIADYLFANTMSDSKKFFEKCRELESELEYFSLRSIGVASAGLSALNCHQQMVNQLCHLVIRKWVDGGQGSQIAANELVSKFDFAELEPEHLIGQLVDRTATLQNDSQLRNVASGLHSALSVPHEFSVAQLREHFESVLGSTELFQAMDLPHPPICSQLENWARQLASEFGGRISDSIASQLEGERLDIRAAILGTDAFCSWIHTQRSSIRSKIGSLNEKLSILEAEMVGWSAKDPEERTYTMDQMLKQYIEINIQELRLRYCERMFQLTNAHINNAAESNALLIQNLEATIGSRFGIEAQAKIQVTESTQFDYAFANAMEKLLPSLVDHVEQQMFRDVIQPHGGYNKAINDLNCLNFLIPEMLRKFSLFEIAKASGKLDLDQSINESNLADFQVVDWISKMQTDASPMLDEVGGKCRALVSFPRNLAENQLSMCFQVEGQPHVERIPGTFGDLLLINETEDVAIANVAFRLLQARPDCIELTKRLHTRSDIEWPTLEDLL